MSERQPLFAGIELGGTKCICLLASGPDDIRETVRIETTSPAETLAAIRAVLARWRVGEGFAAIGVASFGPLELDLRSPRYGCIVNTSKAGWSGADVLSPLREFGLPIGFDTDVNGAALAEGRWGEARGLDSYAYITVGTGVGVGSVVRGRTVRGLGHSEAGHLRIPRLAGETWPGVCPYHGDCVEGLASGPAIQAKSGRPGDHLDSTDPVWEAVVHALGALLHNLVLTVAPQRILLGGGVVSGQPFLIPRLRSALVESLGGYAAAPAIAEAGLAFVTAPALGDRAGPLGALALAQDAIRGNDPTLSHERVTQT
jgi:fructokinase